MSQIDSLYIQFADYWHTAIYLAKQQCVRRKCAAVYILELCKSNCYVNVDD
ncbi:unnamed protein product [Periconia digitata]|uniref:Uncharacterized protein n=1 Tax=Periconia digitata TaxID=1303443 RepID=A0A9W4UEP5_9PLEO|nr:unnamed protein product [Periconia digitata]